MNLVDSKYIGLVSSRLTKFKRIKPDLYNFRCPICGDSQKNKSKTRGYLYSVKADMNFRCHNCGASMTLSNFLKEIDPVIHKQYVFERFKGGKTGRGTVVEEPKFKFEPPEFKPKIPKVDLPKASENPQAKQYLENRKLDSTKFYYTDKFKAWSNSHKHTFDDLTYDEPRIIIPLIYQNTLIGFQGRSLGPNKVKYITVMLNEEAPKVYGMDQIEKGRSVYVVEGPFDATFINNSIALCGSDGDLEHFKAYDFIYAYDNEPRNKEIVGRIERCIRDNKRVVIWPNTIREKDINDMVLAGHDVQSVVESNVYHGLKAKLQFNTWKRI